MGEQNDRYVCPTPCDTDCDAGCHEWHQPWWKRDHEPEDCPSVAVHNQHSQTQKEESK